MNNNILNDPLEVTSLIVLCKLSDGSIRSVITSRKTEIEVLKAIKINSGNNLMFSEIKIEGVDIILPNNATLSDCLNSSHYG